MSGVPTKLMVVPGAFHGFAAQGPCENTARHGQKVEDLRGHNT
jgi:hypothetical protein